jgi:hypothetical protein
MRQLAVWASIALSLIASTAQTADNDEDMFLPRPPGFKPVSALADKGTLVVEFVPDGESGDAWTAKVTGKILRGRHNQDPEMYQFITNMVWAKDCKSGSATKAVAAAENGYRSSLWLFTCPSAARPPNGEVVLSKVISGADATYVVTYAWRQKLTPQIVEDGSGYLRKVVVCDRRLADRLCPAGMH